MQVCSFTLKCEQFSFDFVSADKSKLNTLFTNNGLYSYFTIPKSKKFHMKITYNKSKLASDIRDIQHTYISIFILISFLLSGMALFFTFYSLKPIRKALSVNDEFIKDILHDFNTPITSMVLNVTMYQEEEGKNPFIERISHSIDNILLLQNNLKSFLQHSPSQNEEINIIKLLHERLNFMQNIYPNIVFKMEENNPLIKISNQEILTRIFDNILSNSAKYNKVKGKVTIRITNKQQVHIEDTGKGIRNIDKIFDRYYKEQDRGLGLGLHIVKKLATELNIGIYVSSEVHKGTHFILDFTYVKDINS